MCGSGSGSTKLLNTDLIRIRIHNTDIRGRKSCDTDPGNIDVRRLSVS